MASRRSVSSFDDAHSMDDFIDDADLSATDDVAPGPLSVCLMCGSSPPKGGDCPHDEVAHFEETSSELHAVIARLRAAALARKQQERALRQLVSRAVDVGHADVVTTAPPPAVEPVASAPTLCSRCQEPINEAPAALPSQATPPSVASRRASRKRGAPVDQGSFFFLEPSPSADEPPASPAKEQRRRRKRDDDATPSADESPPTAAEDSASLRPSPGRSREALGGYFPQGIAGPQI